MAQSDSSTPLLGGGGRFGGGSRRSVSQKLTFFIFFAAVVASLLLVGTGQPPLIGSVLTLQQSQLQTGDDQQNSFEMELLRINISAWDLYNVSSVREWLYTKGIETHTDPGIYDYLPFQMVVSVHLASVARNIGDDALKGNVMFGLFNGKKLASYVIMMSLTGEIRAVYPTLQDDENAHPDALKLRTPEKIIFMENLCGGCSSHAQAKEWDWSTNNVRTIGGTANGFMDCHDIQWVASDGTDDVPGDAFWVPWQPDKRTGRGSGALLINATSGDYISNFSLPMYLNGHEICEDPNHVQLLNEDSMAFFSCRESNSQVMFNRLTNSIEWVLDGPAGFFDFYDSHGNLLAPGGTTYFHGQHNAEYFGSGQVFLFDNGYEQGNRSQVCEVQLDFTKFTATVAWFYKMPLDYPYGYTPIYGDADRLPSGNVLTSFWPSTQDEHSYDLKIFEVEPATGDTAWSLEVYRKPKRASRLNSGGQWGQTAGWLSYSSERFYEGPLIWDLVCNKTSETREGIINVSFYSVNSFKQNNFASGSYRFFNLQGDVVDTNTFNFAPHWEPTGLSISYTGVPPHTIEVSNEWNQSTTKVVECSSYK